MRQARALVGAVGAVLLAALPGPASGQEVSKQTEARTKAVVELLRACEKAGAVSREGKGPKAVVRIDPKQVRAVVAARGKVNRDLVDALLDFWVRANERD